MNLVEIGDLSRPDGALDVSKMDAFSGLTAFFTTVSSLERSEVLRPYYENPAAQISDGRINEEYVKALCEAFSLPYDALETGAQVHGTRIIGAENAERRHNAATDGLIISKSDGCAAVFTADCQAVMLWEAVRKVAAVIPAGWRGAIAGIAAAAVREMRKTSGSAPEEIAAFLGPAISVENYEVGPEVAAEAAAAFPGGEVLVVRNDKVYLDIRECNRLNLIGTGVEDHTVYAVNACTYRDTGIFYSYRREGVRAGRVTAIVYLPETQ
ncbi:MAG: peptidoglycan editing factor PgeF [Candidatus Coatesbacteria bacterium]|nr:MAG: peptidoglycan editing factor PgeF [Candidatus Coatesbacteria bacterium]